MLAPKQNIFENSFKKNDLISKNFYENDSIKKREALLTQYPPYFKLEKDGTFYAKFADCYLMGSFEQKTDLGKGVKWYIQAAYDFNKDKNADKIAFFRITGYDFEKNIPAFKPQAELVISDDNGDGYIDKIFYDSDDDGFLDKFAEFSQDNDLIKKVFFSERKKGDESSLPFRFI